MNITHRKQVLSRSNRPRIIGVQVTIGFRNSIPLINWLKWWKAKNSNKLNKMRTTCWFDSSQEQQLAASWDLRMGLLASSMVQVCHYSQIILFYAKRVGKYGTFFLMFLFVNEDCVESITIFFIQNEMIYA